MAADVSPTPVGSPVGASWTAIGCDVRLLVTDPDVLGRARSMLAGEIDALDRAASRFRPDSEVVALAGAAGRTVGVSPVLARVVAVALGAAEATDGDLDPTIGASLIAAGYDRDFPQLAHDDPGPAPDVPDVRFAAAPGWRDVELDVAAGTLRVPAGVVLDLGATAKAWCADVAARRIALELGCGVLVGLGGDIAVAGPAPTDGWIVRVQDVTGDPDQPDPGSRSCVVAISGGGLATSSTAGRRWRRGGWVLHHILDPRTGRPVEAHWGTVSVASDSCVSANVASTTAIIRGAWAPSWLVGLGVPARLVGPAGGTGPEVLTLGGWPQEVAA